MLTSFCSTFLIVDGLNVSAFSFSMKLLPSPTQFGPDFERFILFSIQLSSSDLIVREVADSDFCN